MEIQCVWGYEKLPLEIRERLADANIYYSKDWDAYTKARNEEMCYLWNEHYILNIRVKSVLFISGGILDSEPFIWNGCGLQEEESEFITECCRYLKKTKIAWVECGPGANFKVYPKGGIVLKRGNYILDLQHSEEELFKIVHSKQRNMIRRGKKEGVELKREGETLLQDYKEIEDQVWDRNHMAHKSLEYYKTMAQYLPNSSSVVMAYKDDVPQAGGVFLYTPAMAYYHHGASRSNPVPGAHAYLMWEQFLYLKEKGVKKLNFVGYRKDLDPSNKGYKIQHFKERFGGELVETYFFKYVSKKLMFFFYRVAMMILAHETYHDFYDNQSKDFPELNQKD